MKLTNTQNKIKQALYRPTKKGKGKKSGFLDIFTDLDKEIEAAFKIEKDDDKKD